MIDDKKISEYEDKVTKLKQELLYLVEQWQDLRDDVHPRLMYAYDTLFGSLEFELKKRKQLAKDNSRKLEIINCKLSKGEKIDPESLDFIHNKIDFDNQQSKKKNKNTRINDFFDSYDKKGISSLIPSCEVNDKYELVQIYRDLVKRIHPDVNGNSYNFRRYWHSIQSSYKNSNLSRLRLYHQTLCPNEYKQIKEKSAVLNSLDFQMKELIDSIRKEKNKIQKIREKEPFNLESKFYNEKWINNRRKFLKDKIFYADMRIRIQERQFHSLTQNNKYVATA